jgi:hypothetical protein
MKTQPSITTLPVSPADDRRRRMIKYTVAMTVRVICVLLLFVVHGWWLLVALIGALVLPYVAVVLANNVGGGSPSRVERPGGLVPIPLTPGVSFQGDAPYRADESSSGTYRAPYAQRENGE